jgi:tRNA modification GTPase
VVLVGPPNAGKSRLFNALLGQDQAIVAPLAGTTRDYLTALCECDGLTVELVDTAGIEADNDAITVQAQAHRADQTGRADLLLDCRSTDTVDQPGDAAGSGRPSVRVWTKYDLARPDQIGGSPVAMILTSAATGWGIEELRRAIGQMIRSQDEDGSLPAGTAARCRGSILRAEQALRSAWETLLLGGGDELVAADLRLAIDELGRVVGAVVTDDILDRIFRRFCIGK